MGWIIYSFGMHNFIHYDNFTEIIFYGEKDQVNPSYL